MKLDIINIPEFIGTSKLKTYKDIIIYFSKFTKQFYIQNDLYCECHHIIPVCEGGTDNDGLIFLPLEFHFKAHLFRAIEHTNLKYKNKNFLACNLIICNKNLLFDEQILLNFWNNFSNEVFLVKQENLKHLEKIRNNRKGKKFENERKWFILLDTMEIFHGVEEINKKYKISPGNVTAYCKENYGYKKGKCWAYYDSSKSENFYKQLFEKRKLNVKQGKIIICNETGERFESIRQTANNFNIYHQYLLRHLNNKAKSPVKNLTFSYLK